MVRQPVVALRRALEEPEDLQGSQNRAYNDRRYGHDL